MGKKVNVINGAPLVREALSRVAEADRLQFIDHPMADHLAAHLRETANVLGQAAEAASIALAITEADPGMDHVAQDWVDALSTVEQLGPRVPATA
jgi:hypothetical protein